MEVSLDYLVGFLLDIAGLYRWFPAVTYVMQKKTTPIVDIKLRGNWFEFENSIIIIISSKKKQTKAANSCSENF